MSKVGWLCRFMSPGKFNAFGPRSISTALSTGVPLGALRPLQDCDDPLVPYQDVPLPNHRSSIIHCDDGPSKKDPSAWVKRLRRQDRLCRLPRNNGEQEEDKHE